MASHAAVVRPMRSRNVRRIRRSGISYLGRVLGHRRPTALVDLAPSLFGMGCRLGTQLDSAFHISIGGADLGGATKGSRPIRHAQRHGESSGTPAEIDTAYSQPHSPSGHD